MKNLIDRRGAQAALLVLGLAVCGAEVSAIGTWQPQGPGPNTAGQVEGIADREVSGAIHAVVAHPTNPDILYAGGVNGGIWKSVNATAASPHWTHQTAGQVSQSIGAIDLDPTDASHQTLVAGFGRFSSFGRSGGSRAGALRTTDGGASWTLIDGGGSIAGLNLSAVVSRGATLLVASNGGTDTGVYRSIDSGATFTPVSIGDGSTSGLPDGTAFDLAGDRGNPARLFTSILNAEAAGGVNGIFRSTDTGATWTRVSDLAIDALLITGVTSNLEIVVGTADNVYAGIVNSGVLAGIFRSGDGGATWTAMDLPSDGSFGIHPGGQGSVHFSLAADPADANRVYIGGDRQAFPNNVGAMDFSGRLFRGNAAALPGSQWAHLTHRNDLGPAGGGTANTSAPHADSRDMAVDAAGNLIEGDDGGIYKRTSPVDNTGDWVSINGDILTTEFHDSAHDANADIVMGGAQDTGSSAQIVTGGLRWLSVSTADGGDVAVNDTSTPGMSARYTSTQNLGGLRRQVFDAANVLQSQTFPARTVVGGGDPFAAQFVTPVVLNAVDATRLVLGGANGVYESFDEATTITQLTPALAVNGTFSQALAYGVPGNPDLIYVGSGSTLWLRAVAPPAPLAQALTYPGTATVRDIVIDPSSPSAVYVVDSSTVFQSLDTGATWTEIGGGLAGLGASTLRSIAYVESPLGDAVAIGSTIGVFIARESSGFLDWEVAGFGLPTVPVFDLEYAAADDLLVAGTLGNGAWELAPALSPPGSIFDDGFESEDFSAWSAAIGAARLAADLTRIDTASN